jgi:hypothetical protein
MVGTIGFAGSRARQAGTYGGWLRRIGATHLLMSIVGGGMLGLLVGLAGAILAPSLAEPRPWLVALIALAGTAAEVSSLESQRLGRARQVPLSWKHAFSARMSASLYGWTLGFGVLTTVYFWSFWAWLVLGLLVGDPVRALLGGIAYGAGRAAPVLASSLVNSDTAERLTNLLDRNSWALRGLSATAILLVGWILLLETSSAV